MMFGRHSFAAGVFGAVVSLLSLGSARADITVQLETRPGVTQSFIFVEVEGPMASVILFPGGRGILNLQTFCRLSCNATNFLVRSRHLFAAERLNVAVVDAPSDRLPPSPTVGLVGFRLTPEHAQDIQAVIAFLRGTADVPVWLVGTSRGSTSAASVARILGGPPNGPDGIVLTSSVTRDSATRQDDVTDVVLETITQPALVVAHKDDACFVSPPEDAKILKERLRVGTSRVQVLTFNGGSAALSDPCQALSAHGFFGIEPDVVRSVARWIEHESP